MKYVSSLKSKLIYVFRISDKAHKGCLKIGEATVNDDSEIFGLQPNSSLLNKAAKERIGSYTQTAAISYDLLYTEVSVFASKGKILSFSDTEVHKVLERSGVEKKDFGLEKQGTEWYVTDLETVKKAIAAVKYGRLSLHPGEITTDQNPIEFRPEQNDAINKTVKRFKNHHNMLWNAKMRFGKTLSALQVVKELRYQRTLILTHRPVVDEGWFEDFAKIFYDSPSYHYGSKNKGDKFQTLEKLVKDHNENYIFFASMQDLRGSESVGGNFDKNVKILNAPWDLIIIDEAHEGTQTELGQSVINALREPKTRVLELSGTPFNLLDDFKEEEIFTWDYVMEQRAKINWDVNHFGDPNPYAALPKMNIFTFDLGKLLPAFRDETVAFNFHEFFRVKEGESFIHLNDVKSFLDLICKEDVNSNYPFSTAEYCSNFRHSLWMVPGVKEAKALSTLLKRHSVFSKFEVVNVAGEGDEEESSQDALSKVKKAIGNDPELTYTITLSCGRLTTGVTVKPWTAVFMLAGSYNTSASSYMQTIFRVQSPAIINGKIKEECFVFDFAPDRTLKVIAETAKISKKAGETKESDRTILGEFLNFCPIIGMSGSQMKTYDVNEMMAQLKKVYVERVVRNGFEDGYLYNNDLLLQLQEGELNDFDGLKKIIGKTPAMAKSNDLDINKQGFTEEEYEKLKKAQKKKPAELTPEEKELLNQKKEKKKNRDTAVSILRGISIRMPLMIYGADIKDEKKELSIDNFSNLVDDQSWLEFMPRGVTKDLFLKFKKYYEPDVFRAAGKRIRAMARAADQLTIDERIGRITHIFGTFRNPDKETVLTPWRVVNMHLGDCLGGYEFYDEKRENVLEQPRLVEREDITDKVFNPEAKILEINAKTGLYSLYAAYSIYRTKIKDLKTNDFTVDNYQKIWDKVVSQNIFALCKTPMAKKITKRTLIGFREAKVNTRYFEDLINQIKNKPDNVIKKLKQGANYWKANNDNDMKFNAIVGNPPYQEMDGGAGVSAKPLYNIFVEISKKIKPDYISLVMPSRWMSGGKGLDEFREEMLADKRIKKIYDFENANECFPGVDIAGGICYFLWDRTYSGLAEVANIINGNQTVTERVLNEFPIFIRNGNALPIIDKVIGSAPDRMSKKVSSRKPFGIATTGRPTETGDIILRWQNGEGPYPRSLIVKGIDLIDKWKVITSYVGYDHAGNPDKNGRRRVFSRIDLLEPGTICTETYLVIDSFENKESAESLIKYMKSKIFRFLVSQYMVSHHITKNSYEFVPLQDFTEKSDIDWSKSIPEIDQQLYKKYGLTDQEIEFVESMIKPMED